MNSKSRLPLHVIPLVVAIALSWPHATCAAPLRVMSYNIHHAEGTDGVIDIQRIADVITAADPDVVSLQEVFQVVDTSGNPYFQLDDLATLTGMQGFFGPALTVPPGEIVIGDFGNAVLVRQGITVTGTTNHALPFPDQTPPSEPRAVMEVDLSVDGNDVTFLASHFDHASAANRLAQAAFVNNLVASSTTPAILAGDLNDDTFSATIQDIYTEWTDTSAATSAIDYILYRDAAQWNVVEPGHAIFNPLTQVASDHFPQIATLEFVVPEPSTFLLAALALLLCTPRGLRSPARN